MKNFIYHAKNYFNLEVNIKPLYFVMLYFTITIISTPLIMNFVDPAVFEAILAGEILRLDFVPRIAFAVYEFLLIPLYVKRILDIRWTVKQRDAGIIVLLLPVALATFLSDSAYIASSHIIGFLRLMALIFTFCLFVLPTKAK